MGRDGSQLEKEWSVGVEVEKMRYSILIFEFEVKLLGLFMHEYVLVDEFL